MRDATAIPPKTLQRLPLYMNFLRSLDKSVPYISSTDIASGLGLNPVQVRKDLAAIGSVGRPRVGHDAHSLAAHLARCLGGNTRYAAVLVGAGHLGKALAAYAGLRDYGVEIAALFDKSTAVVGTAAAGHTVQDISLLTSTCLRLNAFIGIITVPDGEAQDVCRQLVKANVKTIWNFTAAHLIVPKGIQVINEDIAASLVLLYGKREDESKGGKQAHEWIFNLKRSEL